MMGMYRWNSSEKVILDIFVANRCFLLRQSHCFNGNYEVHTAVLDDGVLFRRIAWIDILFLSLWPLVLTDICRVCSIDRYNDWLDGWIDDMRNRWMNRKNGWNVGFTTVYFLKRIVVYNR